MSPPLLEACGVSKTYGPRGLLKARTKAALAGVELTIDSGESVALIGRSGSGKSTLGRILLGLEPADNGEVRFKGRSLRSMNPDARRRFRTSVQAVLQDPLSAVNPRHRVERILDEPLRHLTMLSAVERSARIATLLEMVGLRRDDAGKLPGQFSGGQLQRVCLARALAPDPELLILDEAVSNLDVPLQVAMLNLLAHLRASKGISILFITHDIRLVRRFCDRVTVLDQGCIVDQSPTRPALTFTTPEALKLVAPFSRLALSGWARARFDDPPEKAMERVTITIEDDLLSAVDGVAAARGYETRSEAVRDLLRRGLSDEMTRSNGEGYAVATLTFVAEAETRDLAQRIADVQSRHHDLILIQTQVPLDHDTALHTMVLRGIIREIEEVANVLITQRGVRHGRLALIPARIEEHSHRHGHTTRHHQHIVT